MLYWYSKYTRSSSTTSNQVCGAIGAVCNREQVPSLKGRELVMEPRKYGIQCKVYSLCQLQTRELIQQIPLVH
jgi:hypothetical protein